MKRQDELATAYGNFFFDVVDREAAEASSQLLPFVFDILHPKSVCDFGCARGGWLAMASRLGVERVRGYDGPHVDRSKLLIADDDFVSIDLEHIPDVPTGFDLAMSLEVGEHLSQGAADGLVDALVKSSSAILFGAAVPHQEGDNHINEQWPHYWLKKFEDRGYIVFDCIRPNFWNNTRLSWWYVQNSFLILSPERASQHPELAPTRKSASEPLLSIVHPLMLEAVWGRASGASVEMFPPASWEALTAFDEIWIYGTGSGGTRALGRLSQIPGLRVSGFVDSEREGSFEGMNLISRRTLLDTPRANAAVIFANSYWRDIWREFRPHWSHSAFAINFTWGLVLFEL